MPDTALKIKRRQTPLVALAVALLATLHFILAVTAGATKSLTFDEPLHLISGVGYWRHNDYRNQPENGNLSQRIIALPDTLLPGMPQGLDHDPYWQKSSPHGASVSFLFGPNVDHALLSLRGRIMVALASCLLAAIVFFASKRAWGTPAGFASLTLYALSPVILANAGLMTSDLFGALFFTLATAALWACLQRLTLPRALALVASAGGLVLAKFYFPLFIPVAAALVIGAFIHNRPRRLALLGRRTLLKSRPRRVAAVLLLLAATLVGVWFIIWAAYGLRYQAINPALPATPDTALQYTWDAVLSGQGITLQTIAFFKTHQLLPEAFLYGMAYVIANGGGRLSLFWGHFHHAGTFWFYPGMMLVKTPLPVLALLIWTSICLAIRTVQTRTGPGPRLRAKATLYRAWPWLALSGLFTLQVMVSPMNIGIRHLLPAIPAAFILVGILFNKTLCPRPVGVPHRRHLLGVCGLVIASALAGIWAWPNYISYFNPIAGDPATVYRRFGDSNLDWGQDLPALAAWAHENGFESGVRSDGQKLFVSYFGSARLRAYGVPGEILPGFFTQPDTALPPYGYAPGVYAISANILMLRPSDAGYLWTDDTEHEYQRLKSLVAVLWGQSPDTPERKSLEASLTPQDRAMLTYRFETLRFARMCAFLRKREPAAQLNGTINLYPVTQDDLIGFFTGPMP